MRAMAPEHSSRPDRDPSFGTLLEEAQELLGEATRLRHDLHRRPEVGLHNPLTKERLLEAIEPLGLDVTIHERTTGVTALLTGAVPGPTIVLRADTDALPMPEDSGVEFASEVDGTMHACGHDTHVAMLVGAARLLHDRRHELKGRVLFMFQPGEEGYFGARYMLQEGMLDVPPLPDGSESPVTGAFAIHTTAALPNGFVSVRGGPMMASSDRVVVTLTGKGGHASEPHRTIDPIPAACEIVQALQSMMTRRVDVFDPGVLTIGRISAGTTYNVIPETAVVEGTIRAVSESTREKIHAGVQRVGEGVAAAHGLEVQVVLERGYPVTVNDPDFATFAAGVASELIGGDRTITLPHPVMGAEDFSYVLERLPGTMMFLGATPPGRDPRTAPPNHSNRVTFDDRAMSTGIALHAAVALRHLC
jgi:hippurate hydrolase